MLKRMERRFTIAAISVISLVLLFLVLMVQGISSQMNLKKADMILASMADRPDSKIIENISMGGRGSLGTFSVLMYAKGEAIDYEVGGAEVVDGAIAFDMALEVVEGKDIKGFIDDFRYLAVYEGSRTSVYFLDYSYESGTANILLLVSLGVLAISIVMVVILVKVFMRFVMKPIRESYEKQKQFITDASHELKTPLTVIATNMQLIEMEAGSSKWSKSVDKQVERLTQLSNDLVELSRMDEESSRLDIKALNLSELISDVVYGIEPALTARGRSLKTDIPEGIRIDGDYNGLEKLISILLENALKYSSDDGEVSVRLKNHNKRIQLTVENTVDHIEQGDHNELFERFYRGDKSRNSSTGGFGIGLAIAKSIVEHHKGSIKAYSPDETRIVFEIQL